jgi:long-chain fatty acid transport protein
MSMRLFLASAARAAAVAVFIACVPTPVQAGGFALFEQGARSMGFANAFTAQATDPSVIAYNAAGIAFLRGRHLAASGAILWPRTTFEGADPFPGAGIPERTEYHNMFPPAFFYSHQFSERITLGAGITRPFAVQNRWNEPDAFTGRYIAQRFELNAYSINPTIAYKLADRLAIGAGLDIRVSKMSARHRYPGQLPVTEEIVDAGALRIDGQRDFGIGFDLGLMARPMENLSVGVQYRSGVKHTHEGSAEFSLIPTGSAALDAAVAEVIPAGTLPFHGTASFPGSVDFGAAYVWGDWTFAGDLGIGLWSKFQQVTFDFEGREDLREVLVQDYADSLQFRLGAERRFGTKWAARAGVVLDDSPAPAASLSPLLFDADRTGITGGGSWQQGAWRIDAAAAYIKSKARSTGGTSREGYDGTYDTQSLSTAVSVGYAF